MVYDDVNFLLFTILCIYDVFKYKVDSLVKFVIMLFDIVINSFNDRDS